MAERRLNILHLYPENMNLYGDRGNVLALAQRARWREIPARIVTREVGQPVDWDAVDLVFMGGGEDTHQARIADDFLALGRELASRLQDGLPMLAICGAYQLLGRYYETADRTQLPGLNYLDVWTEAGDMRAIGDVVSYTDLPIEPRSLVGFENHGGRTFLGSRARPLGEVTLGQGNNGEDRSEGAVQDRVIATYLHGSLLPKNPHLADLLLMWALMNRGIDDRLEPLAADEEFGAHETILSRSRNS